MTLAELITEVNTIVKMPHLQDEMKLAVKRNTLLLHASNGWAKDLVEIVVASPTPTDYRHSLTLPSGFRAFHYLKKDGYAKSLDVKTASEILRNGCDESDILYLSGSVLNVRTSTVTASFLFGYFAHPVITDAGYSSWIANEYPYAIVLRAASMVFGMVDNKEQAAKYKELANEDFISLEANNILLDVR